MTTYEKRISASPDVYDPIDLVDIVYQDFIRTTYNSGAIVAQAWQDGAPAPSPSMVVTVPAFIELFTDQEWFDIESSTIPQAVKRVSQIKTMPMIDLEDTFVSETVEKFEDPGGLIGPGRAVIILSNTPHS